MIQIKRVTKYYGDKRALDNVSFHVREGELLGLLGPNGAGKSTLMNILTGFLATSSGTIHIDGQDLFEHPALVKQKIGYMPETPPLYSDMTVREYLRFICSLKKISPAHRDKEIAEVLSHVQIYDVSNRIIGNLSKGYRQRVGLAQALIGKPPILILDEPTIGLDPRQIIDVRNLIGRFKGKHTIILSSHVLTEIQSICDRVVILQHGKKVAIDTPLDLARRMSTTKRLMLTVQSTSNQVASVLSTIPGVFRATHLRSQEDIHQFEILFEPGADARRDIFFAMAKHAWPIIEMRAHELSLEDVYLGITSLAERKGGAQ